MPTKKITKKVDKLGGDLTNIFHVVGLLVIGCTIVWSAISEYLVIMQQDSGYASLKDILLLFIYLELGAMVGLYYKTRKLPVIFLIYIAITAITRLMVIDMKSLIISDKFNLLFLVVSILILAISAGILRFTEVKYENSA
jgi:phosphate starvation-inducible membrane PsiE